MRYNEGTWSFGLSLAALALTFFLVACHDEIPVQRDCLESRISTDSDSPASAQADSPTFEHHDQEALLSYGVSEQPRFPPIIHLEYSILGGGDLWDAVSMHLFCNHQLAITFTGFTLRTDENHAALLVLIDDQPMQTVSVPLDLQPWYTPDGVFERASFQLDGAQWYDRLRSAKKMTVRLLASDQDPVTFDLTRLFGTPFQDDIDNCGQPSVSAPDG